MSLLIIVYATGALATTVLALWLGDWKWNGIEASEVIGASLIWPLLAIMAIGSVVLDLFYIHIPPPGDEP
jgi:hypothetical protein